MARKANLVVVLVILVVMMVSLSSPAAQPTPPQLFADIEAGLWGVSGTPAWGDYDNDGDLDLAICGTWHDVTWKELAKIYRNDGGGVFTEIATPLQGVAGTLAWADYDNDGDLDLALTGYMGGGHFLIRVYRNDDNDQFVLAANLDEAGGNSISWGDYDNYGYTYLDFAVGWWHLVNKPFTIIYRNDGGNTFTDSGANVVDAQSSTLAWGDYDNDGDLDLALVGQTASGYVTKIYRNDNGELVDTAAGIESIVGSLAWSDYDSDGDLDLGISGHNGTSAVTKIYRNDGAAGFADIGAVPTSTSGGLSWADYDSDGDPDLIIASSDGINHSVKIFRNDGGVLFTAETAALPAVSGNMSWGDYDNDGDLDFVILGGSVDGPISRIYRNDSNIFNTPPSVPDGLLASRDGDATTFSWNAASDSETSTDGLSYNLRIGTATGSDDVFAAMADPSTGFRRIPAIGNAQKRLSWTLIGLDHNAVYYWSVQAIDSTYAGSPWAEEIVDYTIPNRVTYQVSAGPDDGFAQSAAVQDITSAFLKIGDDRTYAVPYQMSAMRFNNVDIPRSATITSAYLKITSINTDYRDQIYGVIAAEASDNPADFSSRLISNAVLTTASVAWDFKDAWSPDTQYISPDISNVIQEVVNRPGFGSGNSIAIYYSTRDLSGKGRSFASYEYSPSSAAVLEITYETYTISGYVKTSDATAVESVSISAGFDIEGDVTDATGFYELKVPLGWSGTVIPTFEGWGFEPSERMFHNVLMDKTNQDYFAYIIQTFEEIYLSALPGPNDGGVGTFNYVILSDERYPGATFEIDRYAAVGIIGGAFRTGFNSEGVTIFGLLAPKPSGGMVPDLNSILPNQRTLIEVPTSPPGSHDRWGHVYQVLAPGSYTVLFGAGRYGATGEGALLYADNIDLDPAFPFTYIPTSGLYFYLNAEVRLFVEGTFLADPSPGVELLGPEAFGPSAELIDFETGTTEIPKIPCVQFLDYGPNDGRWFGGSASFVDGFFGNQTLVNNISTTYGNLGIAFEPPVLRVGAYIGVVDGYTHEWPEQIMLAAYDVTGNLIYQSGVGVPTIGERPLFVGLESNAGIARVEWLGYDSGFFGVDNIMYEALPQTLEAAPTLDALADFSNGDSDLVGDGVVVTVQNLASADIDRRGILEFNISTIPDWVTITSAMLELDIVLISSSSNEYPILYLHGYEGNGTLEIADGQVPLNLIGQSDPILALDLISIDLDIDYIGSLLSITDYLGLLVLGDENGHQAGFVTVEGEISDTWVAPKLTIQYQLCEQTVDISPDGGDGFVDFFDWAVFANAWQSTSVPPSANWNPKCDIAPAGGGDGVVDMDDLKVFVSQWLQCSCN